MRIAFSNQTRLDCRTIEDIQPNLDYRDEIILLLGGLQHPFKQQKLKKELLQLIADDVNRDSRVDTGRKGFEYWQILVLATIRLGCNRATHSRRISWANHSRTGLN